MEQPNDDNNDKLTYVQRFKLKHADKLKKTILCPCGGRYVYTGSTQHIRSRIHQNFMKKHLEEGGSLNDNFFKIGINSDVLNPMKLT